MVYSPTRLEFVTFENVANREDCEVMLSLPKSFKDTAVHCYMQYVNQDGNEVSTTVYIGQTVVI